MVFLCPINIIGVTRPLGSTFGKVEGFNMLKVFEKKILLGTYIFDNFSHLITAYKLKVITVFRWMSLAQGIAKSSAGSDYLMITLML